MISSLQTTRSAGRRQPIKEVQAKPAGTGFSAIFAYLAQELKKKNGWATFVGRPAPASQRAHVSRPVPAGKTRATKIQANTKITTVVILGPTAVGKTELSLKLARHFNGEIVSMDSRQIYKDMDIGTAKVTYAEKTIIPHHLIDSADPKEEFNLAHYLGAARSAIAGIRKNKKLPFLVGGSALHIDALINNYNLTNIPPRPRLRKRLQKEIEQDGPETLYRRLKKMDPMAAENIHPNNTPRLIRAIEVCMTTGKKFSKLKQTGTATDSCTNTNASSANTHTSTSNTPDTPAPDVIYIGLTRPREQLYQRINQRVETMINTGFIEEVQKLLASGIPPSARSMTGYGYRHICQYLQGKSSLAETIAIIQRDTRHYAKRQMTWWRRNPTIAWFDLSKTMPKAS